MGYVEPMVTRIEANFTVFRPAEVEKITGASPILLQAWRRRKYLPTIESGWGAFSCQDTASVLVIKVLSDRGIGPALSHKVAKKTAPYILNHALAWVNSREGALARDLHDHANDLARQSPKYLIWWPTGASDFTNDLGAAFGDSQFDDRYLGAVVILDLQALGGMLLDKADRPLMTLGQPEAASKPKAKRKVKR